MMADAVLFVSHPDVVIDPDVPVPRWPLSPRGIARMHVAAGQAWAATVRQVFCSAEQKAIDGAAILAGARGIGFSAHDALGENDRSATGYLPKAEFEAMADAFFARPDESVRGWERAVDAQSRIVAAVDQVVSQAGSGDIAIVAHGGVGALLLCHLAGEPISRAADQPGNAGGNYFVFDRTSRKLLHRWRPIDG